ncbi:MAG: hypothetical protein ABI395_06285 [Sphingobium sp.]
MNEPKPMASLNAGLLARKGTARPAMRRAYMPGPTGPALPLSVQDDLGWNDMGDDRDEHEVVRPPVAEISAISVQVTRPVVVEQRIVLAEKLARVELGTSPAAHRGARKSKAAFTLRLDPDRHLRLRLACAVGNRSAQQIVTQALDAFLDSLPEITALAEQVPERGTGTY